MLVIFPSATFISSPQQASHKGQMRWWVVSGMVGGLKVNGRMEMWL
jgi:hypothetical protein